MCLIIADSFEGEKPLKTFTENIVKDREDSKHDENSKMFYYYMHGNDWEDVVDRDTHAIVKHDKEIGKFFHKDLYDLVPDILFTGSKEDEFVCSLNPDYFDQIYGDMTAKIGHGRIHLFEKGGHPAMLSNQDAFYQISTAFFVN